MGFWSVDAPSICFSYAQSFSVDFAQRYLSSPDGDGGAAPITTQDAKTKAPHVTPTPLLREWAKAKLTHVSWKDAFLSADSVSIHFTLMSMVD